MFVKTPVLYWWEGYNGKVDTLLLAVRLSTSCVSNVLAGKPQKQDIFASCGSLRVLAAQELLAPLLARALFLGCTVQQSILDLPLTWCDPSTVVHCEFKC